VSESTHTSEQAGGRASPLVYAHREPRSNKRLAQYRLHPIHDVQLDHSFACTHLQLEAVSGELAQVCIMRTTTLRTRKELTEALAVMLANRAEDHGSRGHIDTHRKGLGGEQDLAQSSGE